ncbi:hypothetical protein [Evansella halocellulosilytica]|uniref:hypothetical protein n=1 Tax=Evansella halocellulosilytica TaxID=2011013 RepID=UPI000BB8BD81|nr:hypothetical protein [Evansella halocellulosilytica]
MNQHITSYVLRIVQTYNENGEEYRIKIRHVQTDEETYLPSLHDVPSFIESQLKKETEEKS